MNPLGRLIPTLALVCGLLPAPAQETKAPETVRLEDVPAKFTEMDEAIARKVEEVRAVVDREAAAKRVSDPIAQSLRWSLRNTATSSGYFDGRTMFSTTRVPPDNEAIGAAMRELETILATSTARRQALAAAALKDGRQRTLEALRTATKVEDLRALETAVDAVREETQRRSISTFPDSTNYGAPNVVRGLRRLLEAQTAGDAAQIGGAILELKQAAPSDRQLSASPELRARIEKTAEPFRKAVQQAQEALEALIREGKPAAEIAASLVKLDDAATQLEFLRVENDTSKRSVSTTVSAFRSFVAALTAVNAGDVSTAQNRIQEARSSVQQLDPKRSAEYEAMLAKLEREVIENAARAAQSRMDTLRARLTAIREPVALETLAREVAGWAREPRARSGSEQESWGQLAAQLSTLAAAWNTASPVLLQPDRQIDLEAARASYAGELRAVRKRIERDVLGRTLRLPELNTPPLSEKSTEGALDSLCNDLAGRSEWRRLYQLLEARAGLQGMAGRTPQDDALSALHSFFGAQNLELAEQWADAAQSYKLVLRAVSERAPTKAAAERLKALTREHPEVFNPATPNVERRGAGPER